MKKEKTKYDLWLFIVITMLIMRFPKIIEYVKSKKKKTSSEDKEE